MERIRGGSEMTPVCLFSFTSQRVENCCTLTIIGRIDDGAG